MSLVSRKVLVTGASGFIGGRLAVRLLEAGADLRLFIRYSSLPPERLLPESLRRNTRIHRGDIRDRQALERACRDTEVVFHLAALVGIPYSYECPAEVLAVNAGGTAAVLDSARAAGVERLVHTSTSEVYGTARTVPIPEDHPLSAQSPYAASKTAADQLALAYHRSFGLPVAVLRPFNTYGPGQSARAVIPSIIGQALKGEEIRLGNTSSTRDFNYVDDMVEAFLRAAESPAALGTVTQAGSGVETGGGELVSLVGRILDRELRILRDERRLRPPESEVDRLCADPQPALRKLGWKPGIDLAEGLRLTVEWIRTHPEKLGGGYEI